ncbi:hypothetical protein [Arsenophonus sp.]|uniref:hypothetical protein n=1 Tax=Arsenophonus sp. TaxID=1872640 RepID=UPI0028570CE6|nr:hypothetical protein [Arsenophonus sp.]MDR5614931.1 hypothetical protein [Arsenophonus sp.]
MSNKKDETFNVDELITDVFDKTRIKISEADPLFLAVVLNQKILDVTLKKLADSNSIISEKFYTEIQNDLESIKTEINDLPNAINVKTSELKEKLTNNLQLINESIIGIPDSIDSKIILLKQACSELHDEFQEGKGEYKGSINQASEELEKVIKSANKCVENINTHAEKVINSTLKKSLDNYDNTTNDIANKMDYSIRRAFEKSSKKLIYTVIIAFIISTIFQFSMWGWFVYILTR